MNRETLHEMIDACRPGSEDVHAPSMQPLAGAIARDEELGRAYQATQRADAAIGRAFRAVSPPEGLADRLLAKVEAESEPERRDRRGILVWGPMLGLAVAASVAALLIFDPFTAETDFGDERTRNAMVEQWAAHATPDVGWQSPATRPKAFPRPRQVNAKLARWKFVDGGRTVCYQLNVRGQAAFLFVANRTTDGLPARPLMPPATAYRAKYLSAAWGSQGHVFVLAVAGNEPAARELFREIISLRAA